MSGQDHFQYGIVVWVRLAALERRWGTPREEILTLALHSCRGVHSQLEATLKAWMYPTPDPSGRKAGACSAKAAGR